MSESLKRISDYERQVLVDLYNQCTKNQQDMFNKGYGSVNMIPKDKITGAILLCERTLKNNKSVMQKGESNK